MAYLGVDLGGTNIKAALVTEEGKILREASVPTALPRSSETVCDDIVKLCTELASGEWVEAIGVGCPGSVDRGRVLYSNNLNWHNFNMAEYLQSRTGLPVYIGNDANVAALGEALAGCAKGAESAVIVTLGTGIGGGVVLRRWRSAARKTSNWLYWCSLRAWAYGDYGQPRCTTLHLRAVWML